MSNPNYIIRKYISGDDKKIVNLLNITFDGWPRRELKSSSLEHWRWRYLDNPIKNIVIVVAELNGEIVGSYHQIMCRINIGNETVLGSSGADVATHPDHRRKGIYNRVRALLDQEILKERVKFSFSIDDNPILIKKELKEGPDLLFPQKAILFMRINNVGQYDLSVFKKIGYLIIKYYNKITHHDFPKKTDYIIKPSQRFDEKVNELYEKNKRIYGWILERSVDYLNWRYADPRGGEYRIWSAYAKDDLQGYIVTNINKHQKENPIGYIMDLLVNPSRFDVADSLIKTCLEHFTEEDVNAVHYLCVKDNPYESVLRKNGFANSRERLLWNYIDNPLSKKYGEIIKEIPGKECHFTFGDFDWL